MKFQTTGLIIRQQNIGEQDKLVTVLTKDMGVLRAFVRGAKNIKNPKSAATDLLCYSSFSVYEGKDKYIIDEACVNKIFFGLRKDMSKLALAQYFCELAACICPENANAGPQLSLLLNALYLLSDSDKSTELIKACVEMRLCCLAGYMPDLIMCKGCGLYETQQMYFSVPDGTVRCADCFAKQPRPGCVPADTGVIRALRHICLSEDKKLFAFSLSEKGFEALNFITETYIARVLEKDFQTLHFYKSIKQ